MHLHGVLGQAQLMGNLLVQQAIGQTQQHAKLLRCELRQLDRQRRIGLRALCRHGREPAIAIQHQLNGRGHIAGRC